MFSEKIQSFFLAILLFFLGLLAGGLALGWTTPIDYLEQLLTGTNERWVLGILGLVSVVVSFLLFKNSIKTKTPTQTDVINTSIGKIKITNSALEHMATKVTKEINGIRETKAIIKSTPQGIAIYIQVSLMPDINIPETTTMIQNKIKEYFAQVVGIGVEEVRVLVTKLSSDSKSRVE
jgi:uncharacterized alkaline shock family protein YloU